MPYLDRLKFSLAQAWRSPALLSVVLLWFMLGALLAVLFDLVRYGILGLINRPLLDALMAGQAILPTLDAKTSVAYLLLFVVESGVLLCYTALFFAGFYTMLRNAVHDGSTGLGEFWSGARRRFRPMLVLGLIKGLLVLVVMLCIGYAMMLKLGTTPGFLDSTQVVAMAIALVLAAAAFLLFLGFVYAEPAAALDESAGIASLGQSLRTVRTHLGATLALLLTMGGIMLLCGGLLLFLSWLISLAVGPAPQGTALILASTLNYLLLILLFLGWVIASALATRTYYDLARRMPGLSPAKMPRASRRRR